MEDNEQKHRLHNKKKSNKSKLAWKKYHGHYMTGVRKRERREMNQSFYKTCQELDEYINEALKDDINEAEISRDNVFENKLAINFESVSGGLACTINKDNGNVSFSTTLEQSGSGMYRLTEYDDATLKVLYSNLKDDLMNLCKTFDEEINQILAKNGLKSTK